MEEDRASHSLRASLRREGKGAVNERPRSWSKLVRYGSSPERDAEHISREDSWNAAPHVGSKGSSTAWQQAEPSSLVESRYASIRQAMNDETERNTALDVPSSAPAGLDTVSATVNSMLEVGTRPDSPGYLREASLRTTAAALRAGPAANPSHRPVASVAVDDPDAWWNKIIDKYANQVQEQDNAALAALSSVYGERAVQIGEQIGRERAGQRAEQNARARVAQELSGAPRSQQRRAGATASKLSAQRSKVIQTDQSSPYYSPAAAAVMKRTVQERHTLAAKARTGRKGGSSSRLIENAALSASVPDLGYSAWKSNKSVASSRRAPGQRGSQAAPAPARNMRWDSKDALAQSMQASKSWQRTAQATRRRQQSRGARRAASAQLSHGSGEGLPSLVSLRGSAASQPRLSSTVPLGRQEVQQLSSGGSTVYVPATFDPRAPTVQYNIPAASAVGAVEVLLHAHKRLAFQSWWKRQEEVGLADAGQSLLDVQSMNSSCYSEGAGDSAWDWWPDEAGLPEHHDRGDAGLGTTSLGPDRPMHMQRLAAGGSVMTFSDMSARSKRSGPEPSIDEIVARVLQHVVSQAAVNAWATGGNVHDNAAAPLAPAICEAEHATYMRAEFDDTTPGEGVDSQPSFDSLAFGESSAASVCSSVAELLAARMDSLEVTSLYAESVDMQPEPGRARAASQPVRALRLQEASLASITPRAGAAQAAGEQTTHGLDQAAAIALHSPPSLTEVRQNASAKQRRQNTAYRKSASTSQTADSVWDVVGFGVECEPEAQAEAGTAAPGPATAADATALANEPGQGQLGGQDGAAPAEASQEVEEVIQLQPFAAENSPKEAGVDHFRQPAGTDAEPPASAQPMPGFDLGQDAAQPEPQLSAGGAASTAAGAEASPAASAGVLAQPESGQDSQGQATASLPGATSPPRERPSQQATDRQREMVPSHSAHSTAPAPSAQAPALSGNADPAVPQATQQLEQAKEQRGTLPVPVSEQPDVPPDRPRFPSAHAELLLPDVQNEDTVNVAVLQEYCAKYDKKRELTIAKHWYTHRQRLWRALEKKYPGTTEPFVKQVQARLARA